MPQIVIIGQTVLHDRLQWTGRNEAIGVEKITAQISRNIDFEESRFKIENVVQTKTYFQ